MPNYLEMIRLYELSYSLRKISQVVGSSRQVVTKTVRLAQAKHLTYMELQKWPSQDLEELFGSSSTTRTRVSDDQMPDFDKLAKELVRPGVTMQLLWEEYVDRCQISRKTYYRLTQFKKHFNDYLSQTTYSQKLSHKAGEEVQVDWAGTKASWIDPNTGEVIKGSLFVATLPFSGLVYAQVYSDEKMLNWIQAHINLFNYLGGVPTLIVPDNLKAAVQKHTKSELLLNKTYEDMANHYHTIVAPTRVRRPKDKAAVENTVKQLTTHLIARMRNYQCFNIDEYNHYLLKELDQFNQKPFQKKDGSRYLLFKEMEQPLLHPLPKFPYEICTYREAKVYDNSHISLNQHYYSVPYKYIGQSVQLKIYQERLEIYYNQQLICQHSTKYKSKGVYTTDPQHLPRDTQYQRWNKERYINWAKRIGPNVHIVITRFFNQGPEQHYYRRVHSILKMADIYSDQRLDKACHYALEQASHPTYAQIKSLLDSRLFQNDDNMTHNENEQAYLRGADYYDRFSSKD